MPVGRNAPHHPVAALTLSQSEAIVAVLAAALTVDGVLETEEDRRLNEVLATTRWTLRLSERAVAGAAKKSSRWEE